MNNDFNNGINPIPEQNIQVNPTPTPDLGLNQPTNIDNLDLTPAPTPKPKSPIGFILVGVIAVAVIGVVVWKFVLGGSFGSKDTNTTETTNNKTTEKTKNTTKMEDDLALLKRYFKDRGKGYVRSGFIDKTYKDNDIIADASTSIKFLYDESDFAPADYITYHNRAYKIVYEDYSNPTAYAAYKDVELIYDPKGKEGQTVKYSYDGTKEHETDWTIIYDNDDSYEIIPPDKIGELDLGFSDKKKEIDEMCDYDASCYSQKYLPLFIEEKDAYNNIIKLLNDESEKVITNPNKISVRAVGSNPNNKYAEASNYIEEKMLEITNLYEESSRKSGNLYFTLTESIKLKDADNNYEYDKTRLYYYGIQEILSKYNYPFASRRTFGGFRQAISGNSLEVNLHSNGIDGVYYFVFRVTGSKDEARVELMGRAGALRPVVKIAK